MDDTLLKGLIFYIIVGMIIAEAGKPYVEKKRGVPVTFPQYMIAAIFWLPIIIGILFKRK